MAMRDAEIGDGFKNPKKIAIKCLKTLRCLSRPAWLIKRPTVFGRFSILDQKSAKYRRENLRSLTEK
jgi:hypothetical protein